MEISKDTPSVTGSRELRAGPSPSDSRDFQQTDLFGPRHSHANPGRPPASGEARKTSGTCGPLLPPSSASVALCSSLASRLIRLMPSNGSMEFALTWKRCTTPSGLRFFRLRASVRRTRDIESSGVRSARARPSPDSSHHGSLDPQKALARVLSQLRGGEKRTANLDDVVQLIAPWLSPRATEFATTDVEGLERRRQECKDRGSSGNGFGLTLSQAIASPFPWPTTTAGDAKTSRNRTSGRREGSRHHDGVTLCDAISLLAWATPAARDWRDGRASQETMGGNSRPLNEQVTYMLPGTTSTSSGASTEESDVSRPLNPGFSAWLMGFPQDGQTPGWDTCSPGWSSWVMVKRLLDEYWRTQEPTGSDDCKESETPSCPR